MLCCSRAPAHGDGGRAGHCQGCAQFAESPVLRVLRHHPASAAPKSHAGKRRLVRKPWSGSSRPAGVFRRARRECRRAGSATGCGTSRRSGSHEEEPPLARLLTVLNETVASRQVLREHAQALSDCLAQADQLHRMLLVVHGNINSRLIDGGQNLRMLQSALRYAPTEPVVA